MFWYTFICFHSKTVLVFSCSFRSLNYYAFILLSLSFTYPSLTQFQDWFASFAYFLVELLQNHLLPLVWTEASILFILHFLLLSILSLSIVLQFLEIKCRFLAYVNDIFELILIFILFIVLKNLNLLWFFRCSNHDFIIFLVQKVRIKLLLENWLSSFWFVTILCFIFWLKQIWIFFLVLLFLLFLLHWVLLLLLLTSLSCG